MTHTTIPIDQISPNPEQPRKHFQQDELASLAQSIRENGIIQPIVVEERAPGEYIIHDGERRWRAARLIGLYAVPAWVTASPSGFDAGQRLIRALVANVQRADLNPIEEGQAYRQLRDNGLSLTRIGELVGKAGHVVSSRLTLLELDEPIQKLVAADQLPRDARVARALLSIPDTETRIKLAQRLARPGITITAAVNACQRLKERLNEAAQATPSDTPAVALLNKRPKPEQTAPWRNVRSAAQGMCDQCDANPHLDNVPEPAWALILESARQTCDACSLRAHASLSICRECPGVELLKRLAGGGSHE